MKMKKIFASVAAVAAASALSVSVSAADWSQASYADEDPATVNIISSDANSVTFTATKDGTAAKCRITLDKVLKNPEDAAKIKSMTWKVTYNGFTPTAVPGGVGGGCYAGTQNSVTYWISPDYDEEGNAGWQDASKTVEDSVKYLLPSSVPSADSELVFMDWSNSNLVTDNITITVSDLKIFDSTGNEIEQLGYGEYVEASAETEAAAEETEAPAETEAAVEETEAPAETEAAVEEVVEDEAPAEVVEEVVEEAAPVETEAAPVADTTTAPVATGNTAAAAIAAVMAVAGAAAVISKRK